MKLFKFLQPHKADYKEYKGSGIEGPVYEDTVEIKGYYQQEREIVKDDDGNEIISNSRFYTSADEDFPPQSILDINNRDNEVITASKYYNALNGKLSHVEVALK